jgi:sulfatase maturation enzyme AslB (radical SAM superfamily)
MTPKDVLTNRKFCPIPWTGLMYNTDGAVKNCIRSSGPIGNLKDNSIQEILLGSPNLSTQQAMLSNLPGTNCDPCYELEQNKTGFDIISDRVFYIRELKHVPMETYQHGQHDLQTVDIRWTNLCNFSCVYCGPEFSSRWAVELQKPMVTPDQKQLQAFKNYIFEQAHQLKHVYLAGGEPLLMKENLEILSLLKEVNPKVNLRINTNLSKTDTAIFDRICEFEHVHWTVSVESTNLEFEYIRYGGNWEDFLSNLQRIKQLNHKISFNMLWFLLNFNSIFDCIDYLKSLGFHNNSFVIGALGRPEYLNIRHLPEHVLKLLKEKLHNKINSCPGYLLEESYKNLLSYMDQPFEKDLSGSFEKLKELDLRRSIDSSKIFNDLYQLKEED